MNILQEIICDHYEEIKYILHPRHSIMENIDRMINCGDPSYGGAMYGCTKCGNLKFVPFRCKSRFCPTCGAKYSIDRTTSMSFKIINVKHRHCVFTIAEELRSYFLEDRSLLNCLFSAVRSAILRMFHKDNKTELFTPGFILVLHTFGRDLKWNPHIHCLLSEGGLGKSGLWRAKSHFNYVFMRNSFQTALLNELKKKLPDSFKKVVSSVYKNSKNGFYVYAKPNRCEPKHVIKYIGRYLGRPVIATSRIDNYNSIDDTVTFHYNRHEDDKYVEETLPSMDFIKRLIRHIPEKHFKQVRYYGLYATPHIEKYKLNHAIHLNYPIHSNLHCDILKSKNGGHTMDNKHIEELRQKYIQNPPEGMSKEDIRDMSESDLLDMDYFLHEDDDFDDKIGEEGFYLF